MVSPSATIPFLWQKKHLVAGCESAHACIELARKARFGRESSGYNGRRFVQPHEGLRSDRRKTRSPSVELCCIDSRAFSTFTRDMTRPFDVQRGGCLRMTLCVIARRSAMFAAPQIITQRHRKSSSYE